MRPVQSQCISPGSLGHTSARSLHNVGTHAAAIGTTVKRARSPRLALQSRWNRHHCRAGKAARLRKLVEFHGGSTFRALWNRKGRPFALRGVGFAGFRVGATPVHSVTSGSLNKSVERTNSGEAPVCFVAVRAPLFAVHVRRYAAKLTTEP